MIDLNFTNEEIEALKYYKGAEYEAINQLLVSNTETDIALLSDEIESKVVRVSYNKDNVIKNLEVIKKIYELMIKNYYKKAKKEGWAFTRGTNIAEMERLKNELYIDKFLSTTMDEKKAANEFSSVWNRPVIIHICGEANIPYIDVDEILGKTNENKEIIIAPFTKIKKISENNEIKLEDNSKSIRSYTIDLEKQELGKLTDEERNGLYSFIIDNANLINMKLNECIDLEKENLKNYENIRKLEQLLAKYENVIERKENEKDYPETERKSDEDDISRINKELDELKLLSSELFKIKKENIDFVTNWKKNIAVYMMAECREIELKYEALNKLIEEKKEEKIKIYKEEIKKEIEKKENLNFEELLSNVRNEWKDNMDLSDKLLEEITHLITKQQNHAKIAGNLGTSYSALNNGFEMRKVAEVLNDLIKNIKLKIESISEIENKEVAKEKLETISSINIQIGTLMNYLNNPKIATKDSKLSRFDEMAIIEENELKRGIAERIRDIRGEAELKKLKDDLEMIEDKGALSRFFGIFTGKNKLDEFMLEQIEIRQKAIRKTLSKKLSLAHNYSIHELVAEIRMFVDDNYDDELVEEDVADLEALEDELKKNFVIIESKVEDIIEKREGRNLPVDDRKASRKELIEIETYRFLNKYGYDISDDEKAEPPYQDTVASEIARVVEYINSSRILTL